MFGVVGPERMYGANGLYKWTMFAFLAGAVATFAAWLVKRKWPNKYTKCKFFVLFFVELTNRKMRQLSISPSLSLDCCTMPPTIGLSCGLESLSRGSSCRTSTTDIQAGGQSIVMSFRSVLQSARLSVALSNSSVSRILEAPCLAGGETLPMRLAAMVLVARFLRCPSRGTLVLG